MCQVRQIAEMGAYVKLLEYDDAEGMILLSELSRRRIRSIQKLVRVGRNEVVVVLRVDKEKGEQDLAAWRQSSAADAQKGAFLLTSLPLPFFLLRLHRPVEAPCIAGRRCQVRGAIQQVQGCPDNHGAHCREAQQADRVAVREHRLAARPQVRACV